MVEQGKEIEDDDQSGGIYVKCERTTVELVCQENTIENAGKIERMQIRTCQYSDTKCMYTIASQAPTALLDLLTKDQEGFSQKVE